MGINEEYSSMEQTNLEQKIRKEMAGLVERIFNDEPPFSELSLLPPLNFYQQRLELYDSAQRKRVLKSLIACKKSNICNEFSCPPEASECINNFLRETSEILPKQFRRVGLYPFSRKQAKDTITCILKEEMRGFNERRGNEFKNLKNFSKRGEWIQFLSKEDLLAIFYSEGDHAFGVSIGIADPLYLLDIGTLWGVPSGASWTFDSGAECKQKATTAARAASLVVNYLVDRMKSD